MQTHLVRPARLDNIYVKANNGVARLGAQSLHSRKHAGRIISVCDLAQIHRILCLCLLALLLLTVVSLGALVFRWHADTSRISAVRFRHGARLICSVVFSVSNRFSIDGVLTAVIVVTCHRGTEGDVGSK
jgi:hypothetical protein